MLPDSATLTSFVSFVRFFIKNLTGCIPSGKLIQQRNELKRPTIIIEFTNVPISQNRTLIFTY